MVWPGKNIKMEIECQPIYLNLIIGLIKKYSSSNIYKFVSYTDQISVN